MGKKAAPVKMSMTELNTKFGGDAANSMLPSQSEGKDFGKSKGKGKGLRDYDDSKAELNDWRTPGGGKGGGFRDRDDDRGGKGRGGFRDRDRDAGDSRADTGDWFAKDRPAGGDRDGDRRGGGGGGFRDRDRDREDNTQAGKDDDWRGGSRDGPPRRGGFGDRDRRDDDAGRWGRGGDSGPSERPKLNLKPRTKTDGEKDEKDEKDEDGFEPAKKGGKYVPPSQRKAEEKANDDDSDDDDDAGATSTKWIPPSMRKKQEEENKARESREEKARERDADARKRREENEKRRQVEDEEKERRKKELADKRAKDEASGYVPPHLKAKQEEERKREEARKEKANKERSELDARAAAEKARKVEIQREREYEAQQRKEEVRLKSQKAREQARGGSKIKYDQEKIDAFGAKCEEVINSKGDVKALVSEVDDMLGADELTSVAPMNILLKNMLRFCRRKSDKDVKDTVKKFAPLINDLISKSGLHRMKVKVLIEAQREASKMGLPRLSPESSLLEVFFDGLYLAEIVEEQYFEMWAVHTDDTDGKTTAMFQIQDFLNFLKKGVYEGEETPPPSDNDDEEEEEEDEDEDEEEEDIDIEANVPQSKRPGR
eukprot:TRINITY_DN906_c0_g1_i1.p1 TRINITY_DN906_c0_g1~~TRINITY_DN906_c0_g1_i1.p1  ORF type:complete len:601 (-),score=227.57 TRINITY_DN906_c0_g1_i1:74-1876(-)